jgi:1-deoxy-D-xylulose-5-phosphate synthase
MMPLHSLGIPDRFIEHGSREECLAMAGLDTPGLLAATDHWWTALTASPARARIMAP